MNPKGLHIERVFTQKNQDPFLLFEYENRTVSGTKSDETIEVEVPKNWSEMAAHILATHYLLHFDAEGKKVHESSVKQAVKRISASWARWGFELGYFASWEDAQAFKDETAYMMLAQMAAPNSPQWFNTGVFTEYGVKGSAQGHFYAEPDTGNVLPSTSAWEHPQLHACFIQSVKDNLVGETGIMDLWLREARVFKFGSGTGSDFSVLRAKGERLEGGGTSSGLVSFLKVGDAAAGAIKSGGATRRAAKMVSVDIDHPDIVDFIRWKAEEEEKAAALIQSGYTPQTAYATVSGQNANHSINVDQAFMGCLDEQGEWALRNRTDGRLRGMPKATHLWNEITKAAWRCGDPGLQFNDTINQWNTCPESGKIHASNPCSEYLFLDDTACNLASLNLLKFVDEHEVFMVKELSHAAQIWTVVLEISVAMGQFPSQEVARNTWRFRTLGLGITGLAATLLQLEIPYASAAAQSWSAAVMALVTGEAYRISAAMAEGMGAFEAYEQNKYSMHKVIHLHMSALSHLPSTAKNRQLLKAASHAWQLAEAGGRFYGFRNAQTTCIAPAGTISLLMDSETTGVEPYFSFDASKNFSYGSSAQLEFPTAYKKMHSKKPQPVFKDLDSLKVSEASRCIHENMEPGTKTFFVAAMDCPICEEPGLHYKGHVDMMAAIQPFISGGISKTVNLPNNATIKDVSDCLLYAYKSGLKSISVYRDGCKSIQPLQTGDCCVVD